MEIVFNSNFINWNHYSLPNKDLLAFRFRDKIPACLSCNDCRILEPAKNRFQRVRKSFVSRVEIGKSRQRRSWTAAECRQALELENLKQCCTARAGQLGQHYLLLQRESQTALECWQPLEVHAWRKKCQIIPKFSLPRYGLNSVYWSFTSSQRDALDAEF